MVRRRGCWEVEAGEAALLRLAGVREVPGAWPRWPSAPPGPAHALDIAEVGGWLGLGIGNLVNLFNPDLVVLGGLYERLFTPSRPSSRG